MTFIYLEMYDILELPHNLPARVMTQHGWVADYQVAKPEPVEAEEDNKSGKNDQSINIAED